jgi:hypothetical protein
MLLVASCVHIGCAISGPIKRGVQQGCADGLHAVDLYMYHERGRHVQLVLEAG